MIRKPLLRWAGSKRKLLPILRENVPDQYNRYIEPFCGSACLFFELNPKRAILSDINWELINALKQIKKDKLIRDNLISMPVSSTEYYRIRGLDLSKLDRKERAIRFLYLNRYCFNGVYRTNKEGMFNVPMGTKTGDFPAQEIFDEARSRLRKARLLVSDYKAVLHSLTKGDFVYIDPPYSKKTSFTGEYGLGSFDSSELPALIKTLEYLDKIKVKFLLSYRACKETEKMFKCRYQIIPLSVKRHISGFKTNWIDSEEILVKNYD